jgi:plasmid stability protein
LNLHKNALHQLREAAKRHHRTVGFEATRILENTLQANQVSEKAVENIAGAEKWNANGLYVDLSEQLLARLRRLAERSYRSVSSEAVFVLETVLRLTEGTFASTRSVPTTGRVSAGEVETGVPGSSKPTPILKCGKKPGRSTRPQ